ncbi:MAG: hypothetical protein ACQESF_06070 [Nanobdellota archaeon]
MKNKSYKFNTFSGVFVPSSLAILGAVMYYITPHVLGGVGLFKTILIILLAHIITISTAISMAGIASNVKVKGGGLYYLISRSLGLEFGGSTGIMLYLAQTVSIAFYSLAFSRAVAGIFQRFEIFIPLINIAICSYILFSIIAYRGAKSVIKVQFFVFLLILLSIISILLGPVSSGADSGFSQEIPYWVAFAMFFPAVTGISVGIGMSGDLAEPRKSMIKGTFYAICFTFIIYIILAIKLSISAPQSVLFNNKYIIEQVALFPWLVVIGVLAATSSSALSVFMAAPRTLRAMIKDRIFSKKFSAVGKPIGKNKNEPRIALLISIAIGSPFLFLGGLEYISQILTILFLSVYGWVNASALLEKISKNPSYRPSFSYPLIVPLFGMVACYSSMFLFNKIIVFLVIAFQIFTFRMIKNRNSGVEGLWSGLLFQFFKGSLKSMENSVETKKNYRPMLLAFSTKKKNHQSMTDLLNSICSNTTVSNFYIFIKGKIKEKIKKREETLKDIKDYINEKNMNIFPRVIVTRDYPESIRDIVQSENAGNLPFNTIMFDFNEVFSLHSLIYEIRQLKKNVIVYREECKNQRKETIDVWWNTPENGNFMLLIAHLISNSPEWKKNSPKIRILKIIRKQNDYTQVYNYLKKVVQEARLYNVEINIIFRKDDKIESIIYEFSKNTDLVVLGIPHYKSPSYRRHMISNIRRYTDKIPRSLIIQAHDKIDLRVS